MFITSFRIQLSQKERPNQPTWMSITHAPIQLTEPIVVFRPSVPQIVLEGSTLEGGALTQNYQFFFYFYIWQLQWQLSGVSIVGSPPSNCCVFVVACMRSRFWIEEVDLIFSGGLTYEPMVSIPRILLGDGRSLRRSSPQLGHHQGA